MSFVTSVVVVVPDGKLQVTDRLGHVMMRSQLGEEEVAVYEGYRPVPDRVGHTYVSAGGKVPGGTIFWLGLNYAHMDELLAAVRAEGLFEGVLFWWQGEADDEPTVVVV